MKGRALVDSSVLGSNSLYAPGDEGLYPISLTPVPSRMGMRRPYPAWISTDENTQ